jgi:hypothetical protein
MTPILALLASGNLKLESPTEIIVFLIVMATGGVWLAYKGYSLYRSGRATALDAPFGLFLTAVGVFLTLISSYILIGGLTGASGITKLR